jgi:O-antigen ligase
LTTNPNQLAMVAGCALFVSMDQARLTRYKPRWLVAVALSLLIGYYSASDAFRVSLLAAGGSAVAMTLVEKRRTLWGALRLIGAWLVILVGLLSVNALLKAGDSLSSSQNGQGSEREALWGKCASIFARYPLAGIGPTTPAKASAALTECHNSYLDIATGGGVLALITMLALLAYIARRYWRAKDPVRLGMLVWLATFMMFGYQGRHPIFWMIMIWMAVPETPDISRRVRKTLRLPTAVPYERSSYV